MSLRSRLRTSTLRPFSVLFVAFTACAVPACSDGTDADPAVPDIGADTGSVETDSSATDTAVDTGDETTADSSAEASDDAADSASDADDSGEVSDGGADSDDVADSADAADETPADTGTVEIDSGIDSGIDTGVDTGIEDTATDTGTGEETGPTRSITAISMGDTHTCGLGSDGRAYCWGSGSDGQLGDGITYGNDRSSASTPAMLSGTTDPLTGAVEVIAADKFSCARLGTGEVKCWGYYNNGALGDGRLTPSPYVEPGAVSATGITDATHIAGSASSTFVCALLTDTSVKCWGYNGGGQVGNGSKSTPTGTSVTPLRVATPTQVFTDTALTTKLTGVTQLSANYWTVCARLSDKTVRCWGYNQYAQVGMGKAGLAAADGGDGNEFRERLRPTSPTGLADVAEVRVGKYHTCARHEDGTVSCWGRNTVGEIGDGGPVGTNVVRKNPVKLTAVTGVAQLALGEAFTCARLTSGAVNCWGKNNLGQLGNGTVTDSTTPVSTGITDAVDVWATTNAACAKLASGAIKCWGSDATGALGRGTVFNVASPTRDPGLTGVTQVAVGRTANPAHACAVLSDKSLRCWGSGVLGQIGDTTLNNSFSPRAVPGMTAVEEIGLGMQITCARLTGGSVSCFGNGQYGALGAGGTVVTTSSANATPAAVSGITTAKQLAIGPAFGCALLTDGSVSCWGNNSAGQLASSGTSNGSSTPVAISPLPPIASIVAGGAAANSGHVCAISSLDGSLYCWGANGSGQVGDGGTTTNITTPKKVGIAGAVTKVALGAEHTCALLADKTVVCFGENEAGQLGDATTIDRKTPTPVAGINNVVDLWAGDEFTCVRLASGNIRCFGQNANGQLADGSLSSRTTPGPGLVGLSSANLADMSLGELSACAELTDGSVRCWGAIQFGALGDGVGTYTTTPTTITL